MPRVKLASSSHSHDNALLRSLACAALGFAAGVLVTASSGATFQQCNTNLTISHRLGTTAQDKVLVESGSLLVHTKEPETTNKDVENCTDLRSRFAELKAAHAAEMRVELANAEALSDMLAECTAQQGARSEKRSSPTKHPLGPGLHQDIHQEENIPSKHRDVSSPIIEAPSSRFELNLRQYNLTTWSQASQDLMIMPLFEHIQKGFFVESGAKDGESDSNTLLFEIKNNWTGLLIEPDWSNYRFLQRLHRHAYAYNGCLSVTGRAEKLHFVREAPDGGLSHIASKGGVHVDARSLQELLASIGQRTVDFWSLDIEGSEADVLRTTDFAKVEVGVLLVEAKSPDARRQIHVLMTQKGFQAIGSSLLRNWQNLDLIFVNPEYFQRRGLRVPSQDDLGPQQRLPRNQRGHFMPGTDRFAAGNRRSRRQRPSPPIHKSIDPPDIDTPHKDSELSLMRSDRSSWSQWKQDLVIMPLFENIQRGFFVESGALDGEKYSNSLLFEVQKNWTGLLIEPDWTNYLAIQRLHRHAYVYRGCLSPTGRPEKVQFARKSGDGSLSHITATGGVKVEARSLQELLATIGRVTVDFWSLDIEGYEAEVLSTTDFSRVEVGVLLVEMQKAGKSGELIRKIMDDEGFQDIGYIQHTESGRAAGSELDHIFVNPEYFRKRGLPTPTKDNLGSQQRNMPRLL